MASPGKVAQHATPDEIRFNIAGAGPHTIQPGSALPDITDAVIIDGTTEPDFATTPIIELDGNVSGTANGLTLGAGSSGSTVRGLVINRFDKGIEINAASNNIIEGNFIGTDVTGTIARANSIDGIEISSGATNNIIGGTTAAQRNVISANSSFGVEIAGATSTNNVVQGNYIGTNAAGTAAITNVIGMFVTAPNNTIGGTVVGAGNLVSGSLGHGVMLQGADATMNTVAGNLIGTDATGTGPIANSVAGLWIGLGASNNTIGGTTVAERNVIASNGTDGIVIDDPGTTGNAILGNFIGVDATGNVALGNTNNGIDIDFDAGVHTIGGTLPGSGNVISGNANGIWLNGASGIIIQGNIIGLNASGNADLGKYQSRHSSQYSRQYDDWGTGCGGGQHHFGQ